MRTYLTRQQVANISMQEGGEFQRDEGGVTVYHGGGVTLAGKDHIQWGSGYNGSNILGGGHLLCQIKLTSLCTLG